MRKACLWALCCVFAVSGVGMAEDGAAIKAVLDKARTDYAAAMVKAKKDVLAALEEREAKARKDGDLRLVELVKKDREGFVSAAQSPKTISMVAYRQAETAARIRLEAAYETAIEQFVKANLDVEAAAAKKELEEFQKLVQKDDPPTNRSTKKPSTRDKIVGAYGVVHKGWKGEVVLFANGTFGRPSWGAKHQNEGRWQFRNNRLFLFWQGFPKDELTLVATGDEIRFVGAKYTDFTKKK